MITAITAKIIVTGEPGFSLGGFTSRRNFTVGFVMLNGVVPGEKLITLSRKFVCVKVAYSNAF